MSYSLTSLKAGSTEYYMSHSLNSLMGGSIRDYIIGDYYRGY